MKKPRVIKNEEGYFKFIFITILIAFLIYAGIQFGTPQYKYSAFKTDVKELARISVGTIDKTKAQIFERAQELKIPIEESDIEISKTDKGVHVRTSWSETVDLFGVYQKTFDFAIDIEE